MAHFDPARLFNLAHPIIQAPMAGVSTPDLAAAVSNTGGLGSIGIGASTVAAAQRMIEETRARTSGLFNVNVFCHAPAQRDAACEAAWLAHLTPFFEEFGAVPPVELKEIYRSFLEDEEAFQMLLALRPPIVSFHFGIPSEDHLAALRAAGIRTMATATNRHEAERIERAGIDAIVAQGIEAGGHRGSFEPAEHDPALTTSVLVSLLVRQIRIPVIAAGGIMDGRGITAALDLGAAGVQLGTAFVLCPESAADAAYRATLKSERAYDTRLTSAISGRPARGIANRLSVAGDGSGSPTVPAYPVVYDAGKALHAAAIARGNTEFAAHWAGQGAPLARERPASRLIEELIREM
jgi:nitronate monooxygenase